MKLSGWGQYPVLQAQLAAPRGESSLRAAVGRGGAIARGNGRAYGDAAVSPANTIHMHRFNRMIAFDPGTGQLVAEAGVLASDIIAAFLPRGWFLSVTPGTKFVTLGGMIAADVHGKNHHIDGSFGNFVDWIDVMGPDGSVARCSRRENADIFERTLGGMGLTGIILRAAIRLRPVESGWIRQRLVSASSVDAAMDVFESSQEATYSVAWIDCLARSEKLGRSLVMLGEHATLADLDAARRVNPFDTGARRKLTVPFSPPGFLMNGLTVRAFNALYNWNGLRAAGERLIDWDSYFYPLDAILHWNRIYGRKGFAQFQCVLPLDRARDGLHALLEATSAAGAGSFLAVLKRFGEQQGRFSFPMLGYTLALDFPVNAKTLTLMDRLDLITVDHGGRFYLAKDSRMRAATLRRADQRTEEFVTMRTNRGLRASFLSAQAERLEL